MASKRISILLLKIIIVLEAICALAFLILSPQFEGRNITATFFEIYFKDPFLAYMYFSSVPFFIILYKLFKLVNQTEQNELSKSFDTLKIIKKCSITFIIFIFIGAIWLTANKTDDGPPILLIGIFISIVVSAHYFIAHKIRSLLSRALMQ